MEIAIIAFGLICAGFALGMVAEQYRSEKSAFAKDQYGHLWLLARRVGDWWAFGIGDDGRVMIRLVGDGLTVQTDLSKPNAMRKLTRLSDE